MTRRLSTPPHRRLLRTRAEPRRFDHAGDLALLDLRDTRFRPEPDAEARPRDRDTDRALQAVIEENATLARELGRVQQRCTQWRDECIVQTERLEAALMRSRADGIVKETQMASLREALDALQKRAAVWLTNEELVRRMSDLRARNRSLEAELDDARRAVEARHATPDPGRPAANDEPHQATATGLADRRVLCVGGRARQVPVYREMVERWGGRFAHVDGSSGDCLAQLAQRLAEADVVILQAGYVCQDACRAIEAHCARARTRCVRLDKACALGFARSLSQAISAPAR